MHKHAAIFLFLSALISIGKLHAFNGCGTFEVEAELIYFRPSVNSVLIQQAPDVNAVVGTNKVLDLHYTPGWRIGLNWESVNQCGGINFRWTQLRATNQTTYAGSDDLNLDFISATIREPLTERKRFSYHAFEALYNYSISLSNYFNIDILAGLQYAWLTKSERYTGATTLAKQNSRTWGIGPEIGFDAYWGVCGSLALVGRGTCALLTSRHHGGYILNVTGALVNPVGAGNTDALWSVVPTFDLRFGVNYARTFNCLNIYIEAGYEALTYHQAIIGAQGDVFVQDAVDATMQGPYFAAGISF